MLQQHACNSHAVLLTEVDEKHVCHCPEYVHLLGIKHKNSLALTEDPFLLKDDIDSSQYLTLVNVIQRHRGIILTTLRHVLLEPNVCYVLIYAIDLYILAYYLTFYGLQWCQAFTLDSAMVISIKSRLSMFDQYPSHAEEANITSLVCFSRVSSNHMFH